jgi:hypothetical protein
LKENYQEICDELCRVLKKTRYLPDLAEIRHEYETSGDRTAVCVFEGGFRKRINVSSDSGFAMIKDILNNL